MTAPTENKLLPILLAAATLAALIPASLLTSSPLILRLIGIAAAVILISLLIASQMALGNANRRQKRLIEDLRSSHDEAARSRDMFQVTLQSIGDAVIATDAEGRVTFLNAVAQHLTGWTQQSGVGVPLHRVFRILNETTRESVENPVDKVIRSGRIVGLANHTILLTADAREVPIDDSAAPIRDRAGKLVGIVLVFRDITERRKAEVELTRGRTELELSNAALQRLNSDLELFAYAAGHDLQEPLRTIAGFSELIARKLRDNPDTEEHIRFIQSSVRRMRAMIDGLLNYSLLIREGRMEKTEVRMEAVLGEVLLNCQSSIRDSGALLQVGPLPTILANRQQMVQLFQNLISNSIKYRSERQPEIQVAADTANGGDWLFTVTDNGSGFDMRYAEDIFQMFRRLHPAEQRAGTGLGLAMCKRIVELHGGRIWAESEPGVGSTFRFTLRRS